MVFGFICAVSMVKIFRVLIIMLFCLTVFFLTEKSTPPEIRDALASIGINGIPRFMIIDQEGKIYNANLPMPDDSNFVDIIDKISNSWRKKIDF